MTTSSQTIPEPAGTPETDGSHREASDSGRVTVSDVRQALVSLTRVPGKWIDVNAILYRLRMKRPDLEKSDVMAHLASLHDYGQVTLDRSHTGSARYDGLIVIDPSRQLHGALLTPAGHAHRNLEHLIPGHLAIVEGQ